MSGFSFSLKHVLKMRELKVKQLKFQLGEVEAKRQWFELREQSIMQELMKLERKLEAGKVEEIWEAEHFLEALRGVLPEIQKAKEEKSSEVLRGQYELMEAVQERKIIENLKEKEYSSWQRKQEQQESHVLDDIGSRSSTSS